MHQDIIVDPEAYYSLEDAVKITGYAMTSFKVRKASKVIGKKEGGQKLYLGQSLLDNRRVRQSRKVIV